MPRNGQGVYSLPPVYEAVTGETIEAQQHNVPLEDIASDLNFPRSVATGGTGGASATQARDNLDVYSKSEAEQASKDVISNVPIKDGVSDSDGFVVTNFDDGNKPARVLWSKIRAALTGTFLQLTGGTLTGATRVRATPASGYVELVSGTAAEPGYLAFYGPNGVRRGYIGWEFGAYNVLQGEDGRGFRTAENTEFRFSGPSRFDKLPSLRIGTAFTQTAVEEIGWATGFPGWRRVIENDGAFALYAYDFSTGNLIDRRFHLTQDGDLTVSGTARVSGGNAVIHAGNIGAQNVNYANTSGSAGNANNLGGNAPSYYQSVAGVPATIANLRLRDLGTYSLCRTNAGFTVAAGGTLGGSGLNFRPLEFSGGVIFEQNVGDGTWQNMGGGFQSNDANGRFTSVWLRIN